MRANYLAALASLTHGWKRPHVARDPAVATPPAPATPVAKPTRLRGKANERRTSIHVTALKLLERAAGEDKLPAGVCGRVQMVILPYDTPDTYGTMFAAGCLEKTKAERLASGKIALFDEHHAVPGAAKRHVGVVRTIEDVAGAAVATADIFDTDAGRAMKEYLEAVTTTGAHTGASIGFYGRAGSWVDAGEEGKAVGRSSWYRFTEIELRETSITPMESVPGADVTGVRAEDDGDGLADAETDPALLKRALRTILASLPEAEARAEFDAQYRANTAGAAAADTGTPGAVPTPATPTSPDAARADTQPVPVAGEKASMDLRMMAVRASFDPTGPSVSQLTPRPDAAT